MKKILLLLLAVSVLSFGCANKAQQGAAIGAGSGALIGALASGSKVEGAAVGAGIGMLLGYMVGNEMDKYDAQRISHSLETSPSGVSSSWVNPDSGREYNVTPEPSYNEDGKIYRDVYINSKTADGQSHEVKAKAYRDKNGQWHLVQ